jgi:large subunit ribosomal protein L27
MMQIILLFYKSVMYTVFKAGGKQYRATKGGTEHIELCGFKEGEPLVMNAVTFSSEGHSNSKVYLDVIGSFKEDKVIIFKKKRRNNYRRTKGHRQQKLKVMVSDIVSEPSVKANG